MNPNRWSLLALLLVFAVFIFIRIENINPENSKNPTTVLQWDATGYYYFLPAFFIYGDLKKLNWLENIRSNYEYSGAFYQAGLLPNGNRVGTYTVGLALLCAPFFVLGHAAAIISGCPADGFSPPYQYAIFLAALCYAMLGLFLLRKILLHFFSDKVTAIVLLLTVLATNLPQYIAVDSGQTHGYLFALNASMIFLTIKWHHRPTHALAFSIGAIVGISTITRPTELVILFIPLLWDFNFSDTKSSKILFLKTHKSQVLAFLGGSFLATLPQLFYWKFVTGNWIHKMSSKWDFLNPHWRVLFGEEKGWFVYTPVTILMVCGLFLMQKREFRKSVLTFFILNTWIIIAWHIWRYGGSYSCRALAQSLAVMALPLGLVVERADKSVFKPFFYVLYVFLIATNLFQIRQYNQGILHYDQMNFAYYRAIFWNPNPTPLDMSMMDTKEYVADESALKSVFRYQKDTIFELDGRAKNQKIITLLNTNLLTFVTVLDPKPVCFLKLSVEIKSELEADETKFVTTLMKENQVKKSVAVRMSNAISKKNDWNLVQYYFEVPDSLANSDVRISIETASAQKLYIRNCDINFFRTQ